MIWKTQLVILMVEQYLMLKKNLQNALPCSKTQLSLHFPLNQNVATPIPKRQSSAQPITLFDMLCG